MRPWFRRHLTAFRHVNGRGLTSIAHLPDPYLTQSSRAFPHTFSTTVFSQCTCGRFGASPRRATPEGQNNLHRFYSTAFSGTTIYQPVLPPAFAFTTSLAQHHIRRTLLLLSSSFRVLGALISELVGVAVAGALLGIAIDLADEAVDIDDQPLARQGPRPRPMPGPGLGQHAVELTDMPERERAQKRPQRRRGRHLVTEHLTGLPGTQKVAVINAVSARHIADTKLITLRPALAAPGRSHKADGLIDQRLDPQPARERAGSMIPALATTRWSSNRPRVHRGVRQTLHHEGDLLVQARRRRIRQLLPAQEVI